MKTIAGCETVERLWRLLLAVDPGETAGSGHAFLEIGYTMFHRWHNDEPGVPMPSPVVLSLSNRQSASGYEGQARTLGWLSGTVGGPHPRPLVAVV